MCTAGYFAARSRSKMQADMQEFFETVEAMADIPKTRIRPTDSSPFVRLEEDGKRHLRFLHWGLTPSWSKEAKFPYPTYNARCETVSEKATFREPFRSQRGILAWVSYVEWRDENGVKTPYEFSMADGMPVAFAGLWDSWGEGQSAFESCTMITCEPNELARAFHDRMPAILHPNDFAEWLDPSSRPKDLLSLLRPFPSDLMISEPANADDFRGRRKNERDSAPAKDAQQSLFDVI